MASGDSKKGFRLLLCNIRAGTEKATGQVALPPAERTKVFFRLPCETAAAFEAGVRGMPVQRLSLRTAARRELDRLFRAGRHAPPAGRAGRAGEAQRDAAIGELYAVESRARDVDDVRDRQKLREEHSRPVLEKIERMLLRHLHAVVPGSLLGKALHYLSAQWPKLIRYVEHGAWPIDNNLCENAIRPFVIGRRNWLFADTVAGADASANLYSLVETCKANGIDPYAYLVSLFRKLPSAQSADDFEALLPWRLTPPRS
jgi:hypothetical protein